MWQRKTTTDIGLIVLAAGWLSSTALAGNVLRNSGFELADAKGTEAAAEWCDNANGGVWGAAFRTDWQSRKGKYSAGVKGSYSGMDYGGWWQSVDVVPGKKYEVSAVFFWDNQWQAEKQMLRIEWYKGDSIVGTEELDLKSIPENEWTPKKLSATAPTEADKAHIVLEISKSSDTGVFYMDEVMFEEVSAAR